MLALEIYMARTHLVQWTWIHNFSVARKQTLVVLVVTVCSVMLKMLINYKISLKCTG